MRLSIIFVTVCVLCARASAAEVDFDRDVRPIISENCVFCHGPDSQQRQADLRLDTKDGALSAIKPGDRHASELYLRLVAHDDPDVRMPPPDSNRSLTKSEIQTIGQWIDDGAKWTKHWSFRELKKPPVPKAALGQPIRNPIDAFVQSRLQSRGMNPMPEASRATLIRRLSLDLRGLPPTTDEVADFVNSTDPDAYQQLVDAMLDSPAYGQRMAWNWLDAARYADTNGYQGDRERTMWPWRDWVVRAFNENLPYDQFTVNQLAGDLLPEASLEQKLATGFCRNHMINGEGGRIAEENRVEYVMDMTETMGTIWLGMTLNCCRCHDHKFDPITNEEYYQFFAFFNQTPVKGNGGDPQTAPVLPVPSDDQRKQLDLISKQIREIDALTAERSKQLSELQSVWEQSKAKELSQATQWQVLEPKNVFANGQRTRVLDDQSILTAGQNPKNDTYTVTASVKPQTIHGFRLEALRHPSMTAGGLARSNSGNFVLTSFEATLIDAAGKRTSLSIASAKATFSQGGWDVSGVFDANSKTGWAVYEGKPVDRNHQAVLVLKEPVVVSSGAILEFVLRHDSVHASHNLGRFRIAATDTLKPSLSTETDELIAAMKVPVSDRSKELAKTIGKAHRESDEQYSELQRRRGALVKKRTDVQKSVPKVMVMADMEKTRDSFVLERGLYNKNKDLVSSRFPAFLPAPTGTKSPLNRLALAKWLVSDENPLTARVTVNRFWQQIFGIGLVNTPEDFGRQGEIPVHMDLLNWLAADFRDNHWNVKDLIRTIVTSHTYRQSSKILSPVVYENDPKNRYLARGSRYRMASWMLRDQALFASGLLSPINRGPSVNTYQPAGVWEEASFGKKKYTQDTGEKLYRRSLYIYWRRIISPTMLFDNASRQTCTVKPNRTNTPLQALQLLNEVTFVESARALAQQVLLADCSDDRQRLDLAMQRILARNAKPAERKVLLGGLARSIRQFQESADSAKMVLSIGDSPRDEKVDAITHASWTTVCLAILNLDETLNRE